MPLVLLGCGLRRRELADLDFVHLQQREEHWAIVDLVAKADTSAPYRVPVWVKTTVDAWLVAAATELGFRAVAPHDLRRSCPKRCHAAGGELEQIQFLLGHVSVQTTDVISAANSGFAER